MYEVPQRHGIRQCEDDLPPMIGVPGRDYVVRPNGRPGCACRGIIPPQVLLLTPLEFRSHTVNCQSVVLLIGHNPVISGSMSVPLRRRLFVGYTWFLLGLLTPLDHGSSPRCRLSL